MVAALRFDREYRRAALFTAGLWLMVWGFYAVGELIGGRTAFVRDIPYDIPAVLLVAALTLPLYPLCLATRSWPVVRRWALLLGTIVAIAALQSGLNIAENLILGTLPPPGPAQWPAIKARFAASLLNHSYLTFANAALLAFQVEVHCAGEQRVKLARAEAAAERAQMAALRFQLNPHFLFNTLNAISSLVVTKRNADAEEMLSRLSDFLRNSLAADPDRVVTLDEEAEAIETYLEIERVRFGDRMRIAIAYPPALGDALVPSFILQPLVENAVKYGVARARGAVTVAIEGEAHGDAIELIVRDDGDAPPPEKSLPGLGVGLANIRQRLDALYGRHAWMIAGKVERWYVARLRLPLRRDG